MEEYLCSQSVFLFILRQEITRRWEEQWSRDERETIHPTEMINAAEQSSFFKDLQWRLTHAHLSWKNICINCGCSCRGWSLSSPPAALTSASYSSLMLMFLFILFSANLSALCSSDFICQNKRRSGDVRAAFSANAALRLPRRWKGKQERITSTVNAHNQIHLDNNSNALLISKFSFFFVQREC